MNDNNINSTLDEIKKDITSANTQGVAGNTGLSRQDLSSSLVKLTNRGTPLRDKLKRKQGNGLAHSWNLRSALGLGANNPKDMFYAEDTLPSVSTATYSQKSANYKLIGDTVIVSSFAIAAGRSYIDLLAESTESAMRTVIQSEEWAIFNGDSTVTNDNGVSSFDGLSKQISTNVVSLSGALTGTDPLDEAIELIRIQGGGMGNLAIYCSFGIQRKINQLQQASGDFRYFVQAKDLGNTVWGANVSMYQSTVGAIPLVGDFFVNPATPYPYSNAGSSAAAGASSSNIYILDLDYLAMVDLKPMGLEDLAKISDNERKMVNEYTVLEVTAEPWMAAITGVTEPTA
ncbi:MAG TPA: DUF5309 family protein [Bacteroidia bacterium]|nr:DUF5309 family protein [Bacteroidia bacterium]